MDVVEVVNKQRLEDTMEQIDSEVDKNCKLDAAAADKASNIEEALEILKNETDRRNEEFAERIEKYEARERELSNAIFERDARIQEMEDALNQRLDETTELLDKGSEKNYPLEAGIFGQSANVSEGSGGFDCDSLLFSPGFGVTTDETRPPSTVFIPRTQVTGPHFGYGSFPGYFPANNTMPQWWVPPPPAVMLNPMFQQPSMLPPMQPPQVAIHPMYQPSQHQFYVPTPASIPGYCCQKFMKYRCCTIQKGRKAGRAPHSPDCSERNKNKKRKALH